MSSSTGAQFWRIKPGASYTMESNDKGVRRGKRVHVTPDDASEDSSSAIEETGWIPCPECGSFETRPSRTNATDLAIHFKGALYRCRMCRCHFRVRGDYTKTAMIFGATAAALLGLLVFTLWDQLIPVFHSISKAQSAFANIQPRIKPEVAGNALPDGPTGPKADALAERVRTLFGDAAGIAQKMPEFNRAYSDGLSVYTSLLEPEKRGSGGTAAPVPVTGKLTAAQFEQRLESRHEEILATGAAFRKNFASVMEGVSKVSEVCARQNSTGGGARFPPQACGEFDFTVSLLRGKVNIALDALDGSEQEYQKVRRAIDAGNAAKR